VLFTTGICAREQPALEEAFRQGRLQHAQEESQAPLLHLPVPLQLPALDVGHLKQHAPAAAEVLIALHLRAEFVQKYNLKPPATAAVCLPGRGHHWKQIALGRWSHEQTCFWHFQQKKAPQEQVILLPACMQHRASRLICFAASSTSHSMSAADKYMLTRTFNYFPRQQERKEQSSHIPPPSGWPCRRPGSACSSPAAPQEPPLTP
jgi:hypothetical protein